MYSDWLWGLLGGGLIGSAGAIFLLFNGRIMGASGIIGGLVDGNQFDFLKDQAGDWPGRIPARPQNINAVARLQKSRHTRGHIHPDRKGPHALGQARGYTGILAKFRHLGCQDRLALFHDPRDGTRLFTLATQQLFQRCKGIFRHRIDRPFDDAHIISVQRASIAQFLVRNDHIGQFHMPRHLPAQIHQLGPVLIEFLTQHIRAETGQTKAGDQNKQGNKAHKRFLVQLSGVRCGTWPASKQKLVTIALPSFKQLLANALQPGRNTIGKMNSRQTQHILHRFAGPEI